MPTREVRRHQTPGSTWHLAPAGAHTCDAGASATQDDCEAANLQLATAAGATPARPLQVGTGGSCGGGWGEVPQGCSTQSGSTSQRVPDWAAHYKTGGNTAAGCVGGYQLICSGGGATGSGGGATGSATANDPMQFQEASIHRMPDATEHGFGKTAFDNAKNFDDAFAALVNPHGEEEPKKVKKRKQGTKRSVDDLFKEMGDDGHSASSNEEDNDDDPDDWDLLQEANSALKNMGFPSLS